MPKLLSTKGVAEVFGVDPATVGRWADAGILPVALVLPVSRQRRFDAEAIAELRARLAAEAQR